MFSHIPFEVTTPCEGDKVAVDPHAGDMLFLVDVQPTFMPAHTDPVSHQPIPAGGLPVANGHEILPVITERLFPLFPRFARAASQDFHQLGSVSLFNSYRGLAPFTVLTKEMVADWNIRQPERYLAPHAQFSITDLRAYLAQITGQVLWPVHGVQGSWETNLHHRLFYPADGGVAFVQQKGMNTNRDSYSAFNDNADDKGNGLADRLKALGVKRIFFAGLAYDYCVGYSALAAVRAGFKAVVIKDATRAVDFNDSVEYAESRFSAHGVEVIHSSQLPSAA